MVSLNNARVKARDARRLEDLRTLHAGIDFYFQTNAKFPLSTNSNKGVTFFDPNIYQLRTESSDWIAGTQPWIIPWSNFTTEMTPFLNGIPRDPTNIGNKTYIYVVYTNLNGDPVDVYMKKTSPTTCNMGTDPSIGGTRLSGFVAAYTLEGTQVDIPDNLRCVAGAYARIEPFSR